MADTKSLCSFSLTRCTPIPFQDPELGGLYRQLPTDSFAQPVSNPRTHTTTPEASGICTWRKENPVRGRSSCGNSQGYFFLTLLSFYFLKMGITCWLKDQRLQKQVQGKLVKRQMLFLEHVPAEYIGLPITKTHICNPTEKLVLRESSHYVVPNGCSISRWFSLSCQVMKDSR